MANTTSSATVWNAANFVGTLFRIGADTTPFLSAIGGMNGGYTVNSWAFPLASTWALEAAAQPQISESAANTAPDPVTYVRSQDTNYCQIFQKTADVTYSKQSNTGNVSGLSILGTQEVPNEKAFQVKGAMLQVARDMDFTFLNGIGSATTSSTGYYKTQGVFTASSGGTCTVAAGSTALSSSLINQLLRELVAAGAPLRQPTILANAFQIQQLSSIYGYQPTSWNQGGVAVRTILTDFCTMGVMFDPHVETDRICIAEMSVIKPVFLPVVGKGIVVVEDLAKLGAADRTQVYVQAGLDYGPEEYHGTLTGLTTS